MLSSLRNWANHDRYRLRPSTPAQLCWSSSRLQPLQNNNLIKFAIIRPSTLNHDKNLWNFRGAPDETTCLTGFFRCPSALALICMKLFNVCANKLSLSLSLYNTCTKIHVWVWSHICSTCPYQQQIKALGFLWAFKESADWALLSSLCYDSNCAYLYSSNFTPHAIPVS